MDETRRISVSRRRTWLKRAGAAFGVLVLLLLVFHRPILQTVGRRLAIHFAAKENLTLDLRVEGSILGGIVLRNVHAVATGPSALQSADVDLVRADYSLWGLMRGGMSQFLQNVEVRDASIVLDPAKAPPDEKVIKEQKITLPAFFPDRLTLSNINLRMHSEPQDLILEHLYLDLNPTQPGELRIAKLQLASGRSWSSVTAATSYEHRNLFLRNLVLDDQTQFRVVNVDASKIGAKKLDVAIEGTFAGAKINGTVALGEADASLGTSINFAIEDTSLEAVTKYLQPPEVKDGRIEAPTVDASKPKPHPIAGYVKRLAITGKGQLDKPNTWNGTVTGQINDLAAGGVVFDSVAIDASAADGRAMIKGLELTRGENKITVQGSADLPARTEEFGRVPATLQLRGNVPELGSLTAGMAQPITGPAEVNGQISVRDATITADLAAVAGPVDFGKGTVQRFVVRLRAAKKMPPPMPDEEAVGHDTIPPPYYTDLTSNISVEVTGVRFGDYAVDSLTADAHTAGKEMVLEQAVLNRTGNRLTARARYELPLDFDHAATQPGTVEFALSAPQVGDFWSTPSADTVTGSLQAEGRTDLGPQLGGYFSFYGRDLAARKLTIPEISGAGSIAQNVVYLNDLTANLNARDYVRAQGRFAIDAPHRYSGALAVNIADLETFEPILTATGKKTELAGSLVVDWQSSGEAAAFNNSGKLNLNLVKGRFGNMNGLEARVDASYSPDGLEVPIIYLGSDKMTMQADARTTGAALEVSNIQIVQGQAKYATGYVSVPFIWKNIGSVRPVFDPDGKVAVTFESQNLDIKKLTDDLGMEPVGSGLVTVKIDAQGTLANLGARMDVQMRDLRAKALTNFDPATFELVAEVRDNQLMVNGKLQQSRIQPLSIDARLPFDIARIIEEKKFDQDTPVTAKVQLPRSSVNFLRQFAPGIEQLDGDIALDVNVNGTIAKPVLSGSGDMTVNLMRFSNATLPALRGFKSRLLFNDDTLTLERFGGDLAGGPFTIAGRVKFPKLTNPVIDLQLKANAVLVARSDDLTARADADVRVEGPLGTATVSGKVALTDSHFLKNIDLIPIGLPGRPAPRPQPPSTRAGLSFPAPPLRDWKFDVAVKTKEPFRVQGNLANGGAIVDLHLGGTGLHPALEGTVRLDKVEATLPFSRLEIAQGFLYFDPADSLNPKLDLHGISVIRDYTVHVYVYGTVTTPEAVFTSEPPLPQEEIISLLATGTTREELLGGGNVLAGKAAMLLVQQLYRKVFKKGDATKSNSVFDRLQLDIGNVDPRTGQQTASARYKVNDKWVLIGDIGVSGDFRGMVKYLIRFR